jgi:hypothetical protein
MKASEQAGSLSVAPTPPRENVLAVEDAAR